MSATAIKTELLTVKPASPKYVKTYVGYNPKNFISDCVKQGYVFKHSSGDYHEYFVVMEKY